MADDLIVFAVLGLGIGVVYAGFGLALLVTHRGANVVNFAVGAVAMWGGYVYYGLRSSGRLYFPVVGVPNSVSMGGPAPLWLAVVGGVASAAALNLVAELVVFRQLRRAPDLAKIVASVGLMLLVQAVAAVAFGSQQLVAPSVLSTASLTLGAQSAPWSDVELLGVALVVTAALGAYFRFFRSGLAMQGVAESEASVALVGRSPTRLAAGAWALSGALAGLFGVLVAPLVGLNTVSDTLYVVPALAAVLVGRLRSLAATCAAGIGLGVFQSIVDFLKTMSWYPGWAQRGVGEALPLVVIVVALAVAGRSLPFRGDDAGVALPGVVRPRHVVRTLIGLGAAGGIALVAVSGIYRFGVIETMIAAIVMMSFVVLTGYGGQISLAQLAIAGTGGVFVAKLSSAAGIPFPLAPLLGASAAAVLGLVVAVPALRIRGMQLAIVTLAFAVAVEQFLFANPAFDPPQGLAPRSPVLFGADLGVRAGDDVARLSFGVLALVVLLLVVGGVLWLARSPAGLRLLAVRANEPVAASVGIGVTASKLEAFAAASFLAGLGGAMMTYATGQFSGPSFDALAAGLPFLAFAYLGGITSVTGGVLAGMLAPAGILYVILNRYVNNLGPYYLVVSGAALIVAAIAYPEGMTGTVRRLFARYRPARAEAPAGTTRVRVPGEPSLPAPGAPTASRPAPGRPVVQRASAEPLVVRDLTIGYGGVPVVRSVSFELAPGKVTALIGPNGAGKTTTIDALTGFARASGSVRLGDVELLGLAPTELVHRGVVRTWQAPAAFGDLTVAEDLSVAIPTRRHLLRQGRPRGGAPAPADRVTWVLDLLGLRPSRGRRTASLPLGQQKLVAVGRALMTLPAALLLDEPAAGLDTAESAHLGGCLGEIAALGVAVMLVEHDMELVFGVSDEVLVLDQGRLIASGSPRDVRADVEVRRAYLGRAAGAATPSRAASDRAARRAWTGVR